MQFLTRVSTLSDEINRVFLVPTNASQQLWQAMV
jgi:hypothetical protein